MNILLDNDVKDFVDEAHRVDLARTDDLFGETHQVSLRIHSVCKRPRGIKVCKHDISSQVVN